MEAVTVLPSLEEFLDQENDQVLVQQKEQFRIDTVEKADWAVRKIAKYQEEIKKDQADAQAIIDKTKQWLASRTKEHQDQIDFFQEMLRPFAMQQLAESKKKKSCKVPSGTLGFRASSDNYEKNDDDLLIWAQVSAPDYVEQKPSLKWGELKKSCKTANGKLITADGEIVPGVKVVSQPDVFYVKVNEL